MSAFEIGMFYKGQARGSPFALPCQYLPLSADRDLGTLTGAKPVKQDSWLASASKLSGLAGTVRQSWEFPKDGFISVYAED